MGLGTVTTDCTRSTAAGGAQGTRSRGGRKQNPCLCTEAAEEYSTLKQTQDQHSTPQRLQANESCPGHCHKATSQTSPHLQGAHSGAVARQVPKEAAGVALGPRGRHAHGGPRAGARHVARLAAAVADGAVGAVPRAVPHLAAVVARRLVRAVRGQVARLEAVVAQLQGKT